MRQSLLMLGFVVTFAAVQPSRGEDKAPIATKAYKADFNRVKEGELPEGWERTNPDGPFVTKKGGRARFAAPFHQTKDDVVYAAVDDKTATFGTEFDLALELSTPVPSSNSKPAAGRFELVLVGAGGGKDFTFDIVPTAKGDAYEMILAGHTAVTTPFPSRSEKELNTFRLTIQRRGDVLSLLSNAGKKEKFIVNGKPADAVDVPADVKTCAGMKLGISQRNNGNQPGYEYFSFQLSALEVAKPKK